MRICRKCQVERPLSDFNAKRKSTGNVDTVCRDCEKARLREWRRNNRERSRTTVRTWQLRNHWGMTEAEYDELLASQGGGCAICGVKEPGRRLAVDHDHDTGLVRGLLCGLCNRNLGTYEQMREAFARYLDAPPAAPFPMGQRPIAGRPPDRR